MRSKNSLTICAVANGDRKEIRMKEFKNLFLVGIFVILFIVGMIIHAANPTRTVDFNGEIESVMISESDVVTIFAFSDVQGVGVFRIDEKSRLEDLDGEKIDISSLTEGTKVLVTYRKHLFTEEDVYTVKKLVAF